MKLGQIKSGEALGVGESALGAETDGLKEVYSSAEGLEKERSKLRETYSVQLRDVRGTNATPASLSSPTFHAGPNRDFSGMPERGAVSPTTGHMSESGFNRLEKAFVEAARAPDIQSREAAANRGADAVKNDWQAKNGLDPKEIKAGAIQEAKAQVVFAARELGKAAGLNEVEAAVGTKALEMGLERHGFKVFASKAIDKVSDYMASASAAAKDIGNSHQMDKIFTKTSETLSGMGVTREALKDAVTKHTGKFQVVLEVSNNWETVKSVAAAAAKAPDALSVLADGGVRKDLGNVMVAGGSAASAVPGARALGSAGVVAGSLMRGDSAEDVGRHAFRLGMAVVGGAATGALAGLGTAGVGAIPGAIVGQAAGSALADKIMEKWDEFRGQEAKSLGPNVQDRVAGQESLKNLAVLTKESGAEKLGAQLDGKLAGAGLKTEGPDATKTSATPEKSSAVRELSMSRG